MKHVVFLCTEWAVHFISCLKKLFNHITGLYPICRPVNDNAPFEFVFPNGLSACHRLKYKLCGLIALFGELHPDAICTSGWIDKDYLTAYKKIRNMICSILGTDNKWRGERHYKTRSMDCRNTIRNTLSHPREGLSQQKFSAYSVPGRLRVNKSLYTCDVRCFGNCNEVYSVVKFNTVETCLSTYHNIILN